MAEVTKGFNESKIEITTEAGPHQHGNHPVAHPVVEETANAPEAPGPGEAVELLGLDEEEPSLQLPPGSAEAEAEPEELPSGAYASDLGDTIDFPSSRNSPDIPGSMSMYVTRWDPPGLLGSRPQSPHSELSYHSSIYPAGSTRTSNAGGIEPRSLVRSSERKSGLSTGDCVVFSHQGRPYVAVQDRLPYKNDQLHYCLNLLPEGTAPESEGMAFLEIIRQGPYIGFRSSAAGNRLVQPRRNRPHRLVFFNFNLGVWEQWEVVGEERTAAPWSTLPMVFRSRRMPHIQLEVDVSRVGYYASAAPVPAAPGAAPFAPTPRSLLPVIPEDSQVEDTNLRRISNVLVVEWFKFVDHEKLLREGLEAELASLVEEIAQLKLNTISQVEYLRVHMNEELAALSAHLTARDSMLALFKAWLRHTQQVAADHMARQRHRRVVQAWRSVVDCMVYHKAAVLKLRRKHTEALRQRVFTAWIGHTRGVAGAASKLFVAVQRRAHAAMSKVLVGWRQALAHRAWRGRVLLCAVQRRAARLLATSFSAWRQDAAQRSAGRAAMLRVLRGVRLAVLPAVMAAWRAAVDAARRNAVQAELLSFRRASRLAAAALTGWSSAVRLSRAVAHYARATLARRAVTGWRTAVIAARRQRQAAHAMAEAWLAALRRKVMIGWQDYASTRASLRQRLEGHVLSRSRASLALALAGWARVARLQRRQRVVLARHLAAVRARTATAVLGAWRALAVRTAWRRSRLQIALARTASRRMMVALLCWRAAAVARKAAAGRVALVQARLRSMRLGAVLGSWQQMAARTRAARRSAEAMGKRLMAGTLSATFREWRLLSRTATASRSAAARALPTSTRALLTRLLGVWWARHCPAPMGLEPSPAGPRGPPLAPPAGPRSAAAAAQTGQRAHAADAQPRQPLQPQATAPQSQPLQQRQEATVHTARATAPHTAHPLVQLGPSRPSAPQTQPESQPLAGSPSAGAHPASLTVSAASLQPSGMGASASVGSPPRTAAGTSPARSPLAPSAAASPSSSPGGPTPRRTRDSSGGSAAAASPAGAGHTTLTVTTPLRSGRSYREALVAGAAAAAAAAAAGVSGSPTPGGALTPGGSRSSSVGRMRVSVSGMAVPFVPANTAVIGAGSSPVLLEMAPGRVGEGPITPIGLPELLDGNEASAEGPTSPTFAGSAPQKEAPDAQDSASSPSPSSMGASQALPAPFSATHTGSYAAWQVLTSGSGLGRWLAAEVLLAWRRATAARRSWRALQDQVMEARRRRVAGAVLAALWEAAAAAKRVAASADAMAAKVSARNQRQVQREILASWLELARRQIALRAIAIRHAARASQATARAVVAGWQVEVAYKRSCARKTQRLESRRQHSVMARVLRAWSTEAADGAARRAVAGQLASHRTRGLLSSAMHGWCAAMEERRARALRDTRAARHAQRRRLQGAFSQWRWAAEAATEREVAAVRAARVAALRTAFSGWLQMASDTHGAGIVDPATAMQRAAIWRNRRVLRACLVALAEACGERRLLQRQADAIRERAAAATQAAILAHWRAEAARANRAGVEVLKMQARTCRRNLASAFQAWCSQVELMRGARAAAEYLCARSSCRVLAGALAGWQEAARASAESKALLAACSKRIRRGCLERVLLAWREAVMQRHALKSRMLVAARRVEGVLLSHVLANWAAAVADARAAREEAESRHRARAREALTEAFAGWADLVPRLRAAREAAAARGALHDRALLRDALAGWAEAVELARARAAAAAAMAARRAAAALPAALRAWADAACSNGARRLQRSAVGHLVLRRCMALLRRAFRAWRGALEERRAREDELRRCIKRKKLAFGLFKQWYWEAFDADVQATIRRMFHSTDPAAHSPDPSLRPRYNVNVAAQPQPYQQQQQLFAYGRPVAASGADWQPSGHVAGGWHGTSLGGTVGNGDMRFTSMPGARPVVALSRGVFAAAERAAQPAAAQVAAAAPAQASQQPQQRKPAAAAEPVRALASTFDALASTGPTASAAALHGRTLAASASAVPAQAPAAAEGVRGQAAAGAAAAKAAAASSRVVPVRTAYSTLLHWDSDSDSDERQAAVRGVAPTSIAAAGKLHGASFNAWAGRKDAPVAMAAGGRPGPSAAAGAFAAASASSKARVTGLAAGAVPDGRDGGVLAAQRMYGNTAAAAVAAAAAEPPIAGATSLEAVSAMNAVLVNVANQLTEVSRASLEIAAGVVANSGAGAGAAGASRSLLSATGSVGSGAAYFQSQASGDGSFAGSYRSGQLLRGSPPGGGRPSSAAAAAAAVLGTLSPLSPAPLAPYGATYAASVASGPGSSGVKLPGVVPTWRQVANNTLYDEEWEGGPYPGDLGPVDPMYVGIAGAGAAAADADDAESVGDFAGPGSVKSTVAPAVGLLEPGPFPLHSTHWNEVFRRQTDEEDDEIDEAEEDGEGM